MESGFVFVCRVNAHRDGWNGTICRDAVAWDCGTAQSTFRADFCQQGIRRCFHLHILDPADPHFVLPDRSVVRFIKENSGFLDDQILFFASSPFGEPSGLRFDTRRDMLQAAYWVKSVELEWRNNQEVAIVRPHKDGWASLPVNRVEKPFDARFEDLNYLKIVRDDLIPNLLARALDDARTLKMEPAQLKRLHRFSDAFAERQGRARTALAALGLGGLGTGITYAPEQPKPLSAFSGLQGLPILRTDPVRVPEAATPPVIAQVSAAQPEASAPPELVVAQTEAAVPVAADLEVAVPDAPEPDPQAAVAQPLEAPAAQQHVPELACRQRVEAEFGRRVLVGLDVASRSKSLIILTGSPGVGKSRLASGLLDDPARCRSLIVPVASTWRGREDLLGYVNPVTGEFEPTEVTRFLYRTAAAWDSGDRATRLIIFEEFNISQPEHWLSDFLVRCEYPDDARVERTISLGGRSVSGFAGASEVFLAPSLRFVATINNDHTVRALSPRVIDRAAVIEIGSTVRNALAQVRVSIEPELERAIEALNELLTGKGVAFSVRTARSIQRCQDHLDALGLTQAQLVDLVLANELLAKVRLLAGDPRDEQLLNDLVKWLASEDCRQFPACEERIEGWVDWLRAGRDVFQA